MELSLSMLDYNKFRVRLLTFNKSIKTSWSSFSSSISQNSVLSSCFFHFLNSSVARVEIVLFTGSSTVAFDSQAGFSVGNLKTVWTFFWSLDDFEIFKVYKVAPDQQTIKISDIKNAYKWWKLPFQFLNYWLRLWARLGQTLTGMLQLHSRLCRTCIAMYYPRICTVDLC